MTVGLARVTLWVPASQSLKDKRMVVRRVKDRVRDAFAPGTAIAEVGALDHHQRAILGVAVVGNDARVVGSVLDDVVRAIEREADVVGVEREVESRDDAGQLGGAWKHWEP